MGIEPVGVFTIVVGLNCLIAGSQATVIFFAMMTVFGGAAAILLGSAGIQPGHLFLGFLFFDIL